MGWMDGKVVLVTGGTRGIGRGCVEMLAAEGAKVAFTGRDADAARSVEEAVAKSGGAARFIRADSGVEDDIKRAVGETVEAYGALTGLVNNAIATDTMRTGRDSHVTDVDNGTFEVIMRVAVFGTVWGCKYAIPHMIEAGRGSIVNISAASSKGAMPLRPAYHASKGAINSLTRHIAVDYGQRDIRCNTIITGFINNGGAGMKSIIENPAMSAAIRKNIMVPRFGEPADIAAAVTFLLSDKSKYVTGVELPVDGGALCHQSLPDLGMGAAKQQGE